MVLRIRGLCLDSGLWTLEMRRKEEGGKMWAVGFGGDGGFGDTWRLSDWVMVGHRQTVGFTGRERDGWCKKEEEDAFWRLESFKLVTLHLLGNEDWKVQIKGIRFARGREVGWVSLHYASSWWASLTIAFEILERTSFPFSLIERVVRTLWDTFPKRGVWDGTPLIWLLILFRSSIQFSIKDGVFWYFKNSANLFGVAFWNNNNNNNNI